jgi:hypothetical protein
MPVAAVVFRRPLGQHWRRVDAMSAHITRKDDGMNYRKALEALSPLLMSAALAGCTATASAGPAAPDDTSSGSTCAMDDTVTGCSSPSTGYSCTGSDTPDQSDSSLVCSYGVQGNAGSTLFCCLAPASASNSCAPDSTVTGCSGASYGFSCSNASDNPMDEYSNLTCSTPVPGNAGSSLYCCQ